jgi:hypothetical protein
VPLLRFQSNRISPHGATGLTLNRSFTPRLPPLRHYHWFKVRRIRNAQSHYQLNCALLPGPAPDAHPSSVALRCNLKLLYNHYTLPTDPAHHKHTNQVWRSIHSFKYISGPRQHFLRTQQNPRLPNNTYSNNLQNDKRT